MRCPELSHTRSVNCPRSQSRSRAISHARRMRMNTPPRARVAAELTVPTREGLTQHRTEYDFSTRRPLGRASHSFCPHVPAASSAAASTARSSRSGTNRIVQFGWYHRRAVLPDTRPMSIVPLKLIENFGKHSTERLPGELLFLLQSPCAARLAATMSAVSRAATAPCNFRCDGAIPRELRYHRDVRPSPRSFVVRGAYGSNPAGEGGARLR